MRRLTVVLSLTILTVGALAGAAAAKEGGVEVSSSPVGLETGEVWSTSLLLVHGDSAVVAGAKPGITIRHDESGRELTFAARPTDNPRRYEVELAFPEGGFWVVEAYDGVTGRSYPVGVGAFLVDEPSAQPAAARPVSRDEGWPVWPAVGGGLGLVLPAAGAALFLRRRR